MPEVMWGMKVVKAFKEGFGALRTLRLDTPASCLTASGLARASIIHKICNQIKVQ